MPDSREVGRLVACGIGILSAGCQGLSDRGRDSNLKAPDASAVFPLDAASRAEDGGTNELGAFPKRCPLTTCGVVGTASSIDQLRDALKTLPWIEVTKPDSVCLPISGEIRVNGGLRINGTDVPQPNTCKGVRCSPVMFGLKSIIPGVECVTPDCTAVDIRDAVVRFRLLAYGARTATSDVTLVAELQGACNEGCGAGMLQCVANQTCWKDPRDYCRFCLVGEQRICACYGATASFPDGRMCVLWQSADLNCDGECRTGYCTTPPNRFGCPP